MVAIFGPTSVGKTEVAIELAELLRRRGEDPVAVSCDAIAVYRGMEVLSGAPGAAELARLEHRLVGFAPLSEEFSAGRFAELARAEIDGLIASGRRPILVGGTGLYMRAALADLDLAPPVPAAVRRGVEGRMAGEGPAALHADLSQGVAERIHPNDRKRIARALELELVGAEPPERKRGLWTAQLRHPSALVGLSCDRAELDQRIEARVAEMAAAGAAEEVAAAIAAGASRTARAALGFEHFPGGELERVRAAHRRYARRQITWMRRMEGVEVIDRSELDAPAVAAQIAATAL